MRAPDRIQNDRANHDGLWQIKRMTEAPPQNPSNDGADAGADARPDRASSIVHAVVAAIIEQRLPPGAKLAEDELGAAFGVSRTIVRAALRMLAQDRVVVIIPNRGAFVASPSVEEARQVFHARRVLEAALIKDAAANCTPADVARLRRHLDDEEAALARGDRPAAIRLSGEFHLQIAGMAQQDVLLNFLRELISRTALAIALYGRTRDSTCGTREHGELLATLARGDGETAAHLMHHHLDHVERDLELALPARAVPDLASVFWRSPARG